MSVKQKNEQSTGKNSGSWKKREEATSELVGIMGFATASNFLLADNRVAGGGGIVSSKADKASPKNRARRAAEAMSDEEDAAITSAAQEDPDAQPVDELFAKRGRPRLANPKQPVLLRIDPEVISRFKAGGEGWQTRMNEALRKAVGLH